MPTKQQPSRRHSPAAGRGGPKTPSRSGRPSGRPSRGGRTGWWIAIVAVVIAAVIGIAVQAQRSTSSTSGAVPHHALGPANSEVEGSASAPVLVEEYGDYQCPICGQFHAQDGPTIASLVKAGTIRFAFHPYAFIGPESVDAASAAECVGDEGRYFAMWDELYNHQFPENSGALTTDELITLADQVGAVTPSTVSCIRSGTYRGWVRKVTDEGSQRGVTGTPTLFVNGVQLADRSPQGLLAAVTAAARA